MRAADSPSYTMVLHLTRGPARESPLGVFYLLHTPPSLLPSPIHIAPYQQTLTGPVKYTGSTPLSFFSPRSTGQRVAPSSPACLEGSSTPSSSTAQALLDLMLWSIDGDEKWLLNAITSFNIPVKYRVFPKEASALLRNTLDAILSL